ncbi:MAG: 4Fe-4S binding protein [Syntrophobacteraceae bacterium]
MDDHLKKYVVKYDKWLAAGKISHSSKVVPVSESFDAKQWVMPAEQVESILRNARSIALQKCMCRVHYSRCDKPLEVCLVLNEPGDRFVEKGLARHIPLPEALEVLKRADETGLVHLSLYMPDHEVFALCNCCPCCCHDLQILKLACRKDLVARSEYVAKTDPDECIHCGACAERCAFGAREIRDGELAYDESACLGCGLCVTVCPVEATVMRERKG